MKRTDAIFLASVVTVASVFAARSLSEAVKLAPTLGAVSAFAAGAAGQPRDVDLPQLLRRLESGQLSDQEALFYRPFEPGAIESSQGDDTPD